MGCGLRGRTLSICEMSVALRSRSLERTVVMWFCVSKGVDRCRAKDARLSALVLPMIGNLPMMVCVYVCMSRQDLRRVNTRLCLRHAETVSRQPSVDLELDALDTCLS